MNIIQNTVNTTWDESILPTLMDYVRIPNKSPAFDPEWQAHGHMDQAMNLLEHWCKDHAPRGMNLERLQLPGRTPLLFIEIPGTLDHTVLLYGHMDKQPEMQGWSDGLAPWEPVLRDDKLYGRGAADDGYAIFAALTAINTLQAQGIPHGRCVILIEACEESGSLDLPAYLDMLSDRIGTPHLVICLDSGCGNYETLWITTSLRGNMTAELSVEVLTEGLHSGMASGVIPSSFRILRLLLDRIEDPKTGAILLPEFYSEIPEPVLVQTHQTALLLGPEFLQTLPMTPGLQPMHSDLTELLLNRAWRPTLSVIGQNGLPLVENAGNVLRPYTTLKLSFRLPPGCDAQKAAQALQKTLEASPPYGAKVTCKISEAKAGWYAPPVSSSLHTLFNQASETCFGKPVAYWGEGGTIPFMGMLGEKFPTAQFCITGVLGARSNAHGPNEFLHLPTVKRVTACVAMVIQNLALPNTDDTVQSQ